MQPVIQQLYSYLCSQNSHTAQTRIWQCCCSGRELETTQMPITGVVGRKTWQMQTKELQSAIRSHRSNHNPIQIKQMSNRTKIYLKCLHRMQQYNTIILCSPRRLTHQRTHMDPIRMGLQRCIKWEGETRYKEIEKNKIK